MGSRRRAVRVSADDSQDGTSTASSDINGISVHTRFESTDNKLAADDFAVHRRRSSQVSAPLHPALTDFGPASLSQYLEHELAKLRQRARRIGHQQEEELREFARSLVHSKSTVYETKEDGQKTFKIPFHQELAPPEDISTSDKGKKPLRKEKEQTKHGQRSTSPGTTLLQLQAMDTPRSLRSAVRQASQMSPTAPLQVSAQPAEAVHVPTSRSPRQLEASQRRSRKYRAPELVQECTVDEITPSVADQDLSPNGESTQLRLSRTSSFETHASQSRDTSRYDDRAENGSKAQFESRRRRKTPVQAQSSLSRSVWASTRHQAEFIRSSFDGSANSRHNLGSHGTGDNVFFDAHDDTRGAFDLTTLSHGPDVTMVDAESDEDLDAQTAIMASIRENIARKTARRSSMKTGCPSKFDYSKIVPEDVPRDVQQANTNRSSIWQAHGFDEHGKLVSDLEGLKEAGPFANDQLDPMKLNWLGAPNSRGEYPRTLSSYQVENFPDVRRRAVAPKGGLPFEIWEADTGKSPGGVLHYLSSTEIRSLRLVCKSLAEDLEPYVFRNVVTKFSPQLFSMDPTYSKEGRLDLDTSASMLHRFGPGINKFGITFDYDTLGLATAPFKVTETVVNAWFGRYTWPVKDYPYFGQLRDVDRLLDDERRLLTHALRNLTNCRELAISLDSGHGWLSGPDVSDLALYREQAEGGSKVFGKTYNATDRSFDDGMKQFFKWAQLNTLNEAIKSLDVRSKPLQEERDRIRAIMVRDYDSYQEEKTQPDYTASLHTGGVPGLDQWTQLQAQAQVQAHVAHIAHIAPNVANPLPQANVFPAMNPLPRRFAAVLGLVQSNNTPTGEQKKDDSKKKNERIQPQWPIIFNGYNVAAESRGESTQVQSRIANPVDYPLLPSSLTEPQAQWLMETSWIQKSFLSAYMDAVRLSTHVLRNVHSLHLSKISSGLLPQLLQKEFWSCLKGLRKVTLLVKPDWRIEHTPGDKFFQTNMAAEPINAAYKFADVLKDCIAPLEHLNSLHIGYLGGGEHQTGIFGRNQHVLPAPITQTPRSWLIAQNSSNPKPHSNTLIVFPHVRTLKFENCWFSPLMLEEFMVKSRDTSLHNLILDSVSLTAQVNSTRTDGPLRTADHSLKCQYGLSSWLSEPLPLTASWLQVLDKITPGKTLLDRKYDEGMVDEEENPRPEPSFRGNIQQITLKSCGYVKILGIPSNDFNQNELVYQHTMWSAMDDGLKLHANKFMRTLPNDNLPESNSNDTDRRANNNVAFVATASNHTPAVRAVLRTQQKEAISRTVQRPIMLSGRPAHMRSETISTYDENNGTATLTGYLTQCIHPVEKRVLEQNWGMKFGWGDDMRRWEAVEDGWFMGGTGRFGGDIFKDHALQEAVPIATEEEQAPKIDGTEARSDTDETDGEEQSEINNPVQSDLSSRSLLGADFFDMSSGSEADAS